MTDESYSALFKILGGDYFKRTRRLKEIKYNVCLYCERKYTNAEANEIADKPYWRFHFCSWKCFRASVTKKELKRKRRLKKLKY